MRTEATWHDDREQEAHERLEASVSAFACFEAACSFYSAAGELSGEPLFPLTCSIIHLSLFTGASASLPAHQGPRPSH